MTKDRRTAAAASGLFLQDREERPVFPDPIKKRNLKADIK